MICLPARLDGALVPTNARSHSDFDKPHKLVAKHRAGASPPPNL